MVFSCAKMSTRCACDPMVLTKQDERSANFTSKGGTCMHTRSTSTGTTGRHSRLHYWDLGTSATGGRIECVHLLGDFIQVHVQLMFLRQELFLAGSTSPECRWTSHGAASEELQLRSWLPAPAPELVERERPRSVHTVLGGQMPPSTTKEKGALLKLSRFSTSHPTFQQSSDHQAFDISWHRRSTER